MNQKSVLVSTIAVIVMVALAVFLSTDRNTEAEATALFPGFSATGISRVEVKSGDAEVTLILADGEWRVAERGNYRARVKELSELVSKVGKAVLIEKKTARPENLPRLGLADIGAEDSEAVLLTVTSTENSYAVLIGEQSSGRNGTYVRLPGDNQAWLTDATLKVEKDAAKWIESVIVDVEADQVAQVRLESADVALTFERGEDDEFAFKELPESRSLKYPSISGEPARALVKVRLEDVAVHDPEKWQGAHEAEFVLKNQTTIRVLATGDGDENWLHLVVTPSEGETADYGDLGAWDYRVAGYVFDDFVKTMDDLLAEEKPEDGEPSEDPQT